MHPRIIDVTERIRQRSQLSRAAYLQQMAEAAARPRGRRDLSCSNFAHGMAGCSAADKQRLRLPDEVNIGMVTAYNDMLSAHRPYESYPEQIRQALRAIGATGQVAGGVPAMCDGVTQGEPGMELSLVSRDVIAMGTAVALSHNMFDAALCLGICDKIVPGLLMGALRFGHLPILFVPAGPMPSGLPNSEKARVRQLYAEGLVSREELLEGAANLEKLNCRVDYVITHEPPVKIKGFLKLKDSETASVTGLNTYLEELSEACVFRRWFFGSMHLDKYISGSHVAVFQNVINAITGEVDR